MGTETQRTEHCLACARVGARSREAAGMELDAELPQEFHSNWGWAVPLLAQLQGAPFSQNTV